MLIGAAILAEVVHSGAVSVPSLADFLILDFSEGFLRVSCGKRVLTLKWLPRSGLSGVSFRLDVTKAR